MHYWESISSPRVNNNEESRELILQKKKNIRLKNTLVLLFLILFLDIWNNTLVLFDDPIQKTLLITQTFLINQLSHNVTVELLSTWQKCVELFYLFYNCKISIPVCESFSKFKNLIICIKCFL